MARSWAGPQALGCRCPDGLGSVRDVAAAGCYYRYLTCRDEAAFAPLVVGRGPMILRIRWGVLTYLADAADAFSPTFLVLAWRRHDRRPSSTQGGAGDRRGGTPPGPRPGHRVPAGVASGGGRAVILGMSDLRGRGRPPRRPQASRWLEFTSPRQSTHLTFLGCPGVPPLAGQGHLPVVSTRVREGNIRKPAWSGCGPGTWTVAIVIRPSLVAQ